MMKETRRYALLLVLLASAAIAFSQPQLHNLDIRVVVSRNGDARITETRQMTIDDKGTECYIGLGNMEMSTVKDLEVSDEKGSQYENTGTWDVDLSREKKAGRCGIVEKDNGGYELCWGLGDSGQRTYVASYTVTGLVRGYPDADALRHVFLSKSVNPKPEYAKVTIVGEDSTLVFTPDTCGVWGFRFMGDLRFENGTIVAETTEPMNEEAALYVMAKFPKGMLEPTVQITDDTFEHKKQLAIEGSDYVDNEESEDSGLTFKSVLLAFALIGAFVAALTAGIFALKNLAIRLLNWYRRKKHEEWAKSVDYFRSIPLEGNLQEANDMLNAFNYGRADDYKRLISATVLQLINEGAFAVKPVMTEKGDMEKRFVVKEELPLERDLAPLLYKMHEIFKKAAGNDLVLDPKELETFMESGNKKLMRSFVDLLYTKRRSSYFKEHKDMMLEVYGFKRFLDDFTLVNERHLTETQLWRDYMVWATLYGNAEQVVTDMKAINPEFFKMDEVASQLLENTALATVYAPIYHSTDRIVREINQKREAERKASRSRASSSSSSRSSGRGGHSSWGGGGGGFSGGGGGGGVR